MTVAAPVDPLSRSPEPGEGGGDVQVVGISSGQRVEAACRLVGGSRQDSASAGRRLIENAGVLGLDLSLFWGTVDRRREGRIRHVCLAAIGAGRAGTLFLSPTSADHVPNRDAEVAERARLIRHACDALRARTEVRLVQTLPEPGETDVIDSFVQAGFQRLGDLAYMRCELAADVGRVRAEARAEVTLAASGDDPVVMVPLSAMRRADARRRLLDVLPRTYEETLDCPELSGLRTPEEVLASHEAVGERDDALWWVIMRGSARTPDGCLLLSPCPDLSCVELVYLGLAKPLRGRGVAGKALAHGLGVLRGRGHRAVTCAVDTRNAPAVRLYERAGFAPTSHRAPLINPLR